MTDGTQSHLSDSVSGALIRWVYTLADLLQILPTGYLDIEQVLDNNGVLRRVQWYATDTELIAVLTGAAYADLQYEWLQGRVSVKGGELVHHHDFEAVGWPQFNYQLFGARPITTETEFRAEMARLVAARGGIIGMHTYSFTAPIEKTGIEGNHLRVIIPEAVLSNMREAWLTANTRCA